MFLSFYEHNGYISFHASDLPARFPPFFPPIQMLDIFPSARIIVSALIIGAFLMKGALAQMETTSLSSRVLRQFLTVDRKHRCMIEKQMQSFGIHRSQHMMLMYLSRRTTPPTQTEIANEFGISPATVAVTLQKLNAAGLIERLSSKADTRAKDIRLTEAGADIVRRSMALAAEVDERMCSGISEEELNTLLNVLTRMSDNLASAHS